MLTDFQYPNEPAGGYGMNGALGAPGTTSQFKWGRLINTAGGIQLAKAIKAYKDSRNAVL